MINFVVSSDEYEPAIESSEGSDVPFVHHKYTGLVNE